jgi:hypothetical protein
VAAAAGLAVMGMTLARRARIRVAIPLLALATIAVLLALSQLRGAPAGPGPAAVGPGDANAYLPADEIGRPEPGEEANGRSLLRGSGRFEAWKGAVEQGTERPVVGHGFGTEVVVFVDRYYFLVADRPENSYIGVYLELGLAGLALIAALIVATVRAGSTALRAPAVRERRVAAALAGAAVAGFVQAGTQSLLEAPGGIASLAFWSCVFLLVAAAPRPASGRVVGEPPHERTRRDEQVASLVP